MLNKTRSCTTDKICDIYLSRLSKIEGKKKNIETLDEILDNQRVYYDQEIINSVVNKLTTRNLIVQVIGKSLFSYGKREPIKTKNEIVSFSEAFTFPKDIEGNVGIYELTKKGRNFVMNRQVVDEDGRRIKKERNEKLLDKFKGFLFGVVTTIVTSWLIKKMP